MIILIAGGSAVGKSTIAAKIGNGLSIPHVVSTDFIREIVRQFVRHSENRYLHLSTYDAFFDEDDRAPSTREEQLRAGFFVQREAITSSIKALIQRSLSEDRDIIIEGVHVHPGCAVSGTEQFVVLEDPGVEMLAARYEARRDLSRMRTSKRSDNDIAVCSSYIGKTIEEEFRRSGVNPIYVPALLSREEAAALALKHIRETD
jgi:2-phosphoglycerate kinase